MTTTQVPVSIPAEVTNYVSGLGLEAAFNDILGHLPSIFPDAMRIQCELDRGSEDESDPGVIFMVSIPDQGPSFPTPFMRWSDWALGRHSGRDLHHFTVLFAHQPNPNARA